MYWAQMDSPFGMLTFIVSEKGLCSIVFRTDELSKLPLKRMEEDKLRVRPFMQQVAEYLEGKRVQFSVPLDISCGTSFQKEVWKALLAIPYGEVRSYKDIAVTINNPKAVRAVGGANNRNPIPFIIPCHRVIGRNGTLVGYRGGLSVKKDLLRREGIVLN